jgi:hypothetical protein
VKPWEKRRMDISPVWGERKLPVIVQIYRPCRG